MPKRPKRSWKKPAARCQSSNHKGGDTPVRSAGITRWACAGATRDRRLGRLGHLDVQSFAFGNDDRLSECGFTRFFGPMLRSGGGDRAAEPYFSLGATS